MQLRTAALKISVDRTTELLKNYKPNTAAKAATVLVGIEPLWKEIESVKSLLGVWVNNYRVSVIPERFIAEKLTTITLQVTEHRYRFTVNQSWRATVLEGKKDDAIDWFVTNNYGDVVQETINTSTLSAFAKNYVAEKGMDLPGDIFNVTQVPVTSVTKVG